ncbi:hypothetical protein ONS95_005187 [Cadophora gregata]|uniref:uncharacterized protein n=1 Tax=Cadophora gregata TaxID=51156 RepID=UPI0026DB7271|nr:uncharacterized protein ONS95_005187 [Cadophora gregata]KAK0104924.1 hypothetical protein ONS95_005187 [Cadophora gregata]KAK0114994.1 hypothetical protein ONS96_013468 [Cadophora gregata f. sp. sojae]
MFLSANLLVLLTLCCTLATGKTGQLRLPSSAFGVPGTNASFDYIVVGGGTAGLTIASRLAEFASVAVVEAGGFYEVENGNNSVVPYLGLVMPVLATTESFPQQPLVDWGLVSEIQAGAANRKIHYAQGKTLGGSSALNTMAYLRGTKGSYQRWADHVGDQSYTFPNLLPFFQKSAHFTPPDLSKRATSNAIPVYDPAAFDNSKGGPLQVSYGNWVDPTINALSGALRAAGIALSRSGFNSGSLLGGAWVTSTIAPKDATRSTSESSYLDDAIKRTQLIVYTHTQATKILFDGNKKAVGVRVSTQGLEYTLSANKEVIISAGVFHSPQLLMVSGIGPAAVLSAKGIPLISALSGVGQNLQDPLFFNVLWGITTATSGSVIADDTPLALSQYLDSAAGPYSSAGGYFGFEKLPSSVRSNFSQATRSALSAFPADWPEVEHVVSGFPGGPGFIIGAVSPSILVPFSKGNVTIKSPSMLDAPLINLGWLMDSRDAEVAVASFKRARQIWETTPAKAIRVGAEIAPGPAVQTDAQILEYIRGSAQQIWHASSTCKMGKGSDANAVVDSKGKVFGVSGLRVVDNSIAPFSVPGHPQGTVYMLAEKIADDIRSGR